MYHSLYRIRERLWDTIPFAFSNKMKSGEEVVVLGDPMRVQDNQRPIRTIVTLMEYRPHLLAKDHPEYETIAGESYVVEKHSV